MLFSSGDGYSRDTRWAAIKEWTQTSHSIASTTMQDMAIRYEMRRDIGLLPPEYSYPVQPISAQFEGLGLFPWERPALPEAPTGAIMHEWA